MLKQLNVGIDDTYTISGRLLYEISESDKLTPLLDAVKKAFELISDITDTSENPPYRKGGYFLIGHRNLSSYPINSCYPFDEKALVVDTIIPMGELTQQQISGKKYFTYRDMVVKKAIAIAGCCNNGYRTTRTIRENFSINENVLPDGVIYDEKSGLIFAFSGFLMKKDLTLVLTFCYHAGILSFDEVLKYATEDDCQIFLDNLSALNIIPNT